MLARCPFCGSDDVRVVQNNDSDFFYNERYWAECTGCCAEGPVCDGPIEAERRWAEIPYLASRLSEIRHDAPRLISELRS